MRAGLLPILAPGAILRFWSLVAKRGPDDCWEWTSYKLKKTNEHYGRFCYQKRHYLAHRIAYLLSKGIQPGSRLVCHSCDNPSCCNPYHLWLGSDADNIADRDAKGRQAGHAGKANGRATLTEQDVNDIRASSENYRSLSRQFGVSRTQISRIRTRKYWKHV
jgi:hypothetical protein